MDLFSADRLTALMERPKGPCVSIYLPTHRASVENPQDRLRFKNLLKEAEGRLEALRLRPSEARDLLAQAHQMLEDDPFWRQLGDGLALFVAPEVFRFYRLPRRFSELVVVTDRFHLKPLLPLLTEDGGFYVLALSQNEVRLLQGSRDSIGEVYLKDIPKNLAEALKYDVFEKQIQVHPRAAGGPRGRPAIFHGHGGGAEETKEQILQYFRQIERGLQEILKEKRSPLVPAGVDYLLSLYREVNTYPHLMEKGVAGNPERLRPDELHAKAWEIVQPRFQEAQRQAADRYHKLRGTGKTANYLEAVVPAAHHGRIEVLFVALGVQLWGLFDPAEDKVYVNPKALPGDEDLLDLAAIQTLLHGGTVYAVEIEQMPEDAPVASILRY